MATTDSSSPDHESRRRDLDPLHHSPLAGINVGSIRFGVVFAIFALSLASTTLLIYATLVLFKEIWNTAFHSTLDIAHTKHLEVVFIELTDAFLLGTVLYIIALGLYQLFINASLKLPPWLEVRSLEELKAKLVGVIIVLLGVSFLAAVLEGDPAHDLLYLGISSAVVILALGVHGYLASKSDGHDL